MPITTTEEYVRYSPYDAAMLNRSDAEVEAFLKRFAALPLPVRTFLTALSTAEKIQALESIGTVPAQFTPAVARLICLATLGDVDKAQIPSLLRKIGFPAASLDAAVKGITDILREGAAARAAGEAPLMKPLQPLTAHPPAADVTSASSRGILNLRPPAGGAEKPSP